VIDTSNEIAGEGDIPQHNTMIEAVQNHTPEYIIVDEIGTKKEARACCDITQRGVKLIGTAHGTHLQQLLENPELNSLLGGVHSVIIGDDARQRRKLHSKTIQERMGPCAFDCAIELQSLYCWIIYPNLALTVDTLLQADQMNQMIIQIRRINPDTHEMTIETMTMKEFKLLDMKKEGG
jgi:hypothetical protein